MLESQSSQKSKVSSEIWFTSISLSSRYSSLFRSSGVTVFHFRSSTGLVINDDHAFDSSQNFALALLWTSSLRQGEIGDFRKCVRLVPKVASIRSLITPEHFLDFSVIAIVEVIVVRSVAVGFGE
jgi:hypothetical protein